VEHPVLRHGAGLTASAMPADRGMLLDVEFDFLTHELVQALFGPPG